MKGSLATQGRLGLRVVRTPCDLLHVSGVGWYTHHAVGCDAGLSQPQPQPWVGVVDLDCLQKRLESQRRLAKEQLLQPDVVEESVAAVHSQHSQRPPGERGGCRYTRGEGQCAQQHYSNEQCMLEGACMYKA